MAPARLVWSFDMRLLVDILYDPASGLTPAHRTEAFNAVFKDQIRDFGFGNGIPGRRLNAQYGEKKKNNSDWVRIRASSPSAGDVEKRRAMQAQVDSFLLSLQLSGPDDVHSPRRSARSHPAVTASKKRSVDEDLDHLTSTPLSKRPAIGLWTPDTPQHPAVKSMGKAPSRKPVTPKKLSTRSKPQTPKVRHTRPDGSTIPVAAHVVIPDTVQSISQHRAQPPLPKLLFRLWREDPSQRDSHNGFWSRRHHRKNAISSAPPRSSSIDATDIFDHMDRTHVDTPFISTSNRLIWMVQQMVTAIKTHSRQWHVSVIDVSALDQRGVFWARPFHDEVRLSKPFTKGAGNYRGTFEFLIWQRIPSQAIIHTFPAHSLLDLSLTTPSLNSTLRLETFSRPSTSLATKIALLKNHNLPLSIPSINALATLIPFFGLASPFNGPHISSLITGLIEGWGLHIPFHSEQEWQYLANHFANRLGCFSDEARERQEVKFAFLEGVAWGCGEPNARHKISGVEGKERKARAVGLGSPSEILIHELDALKMALKLQERGEQRVLQRYHHHQHHRAVQSAAYTSEDEMDGGVGQHEPKGVEMGDEFASEGDEEIMFDSGEDEDFILMG